MKNRPQKNQKLRKSSRHLRLVKLQGPTEKEPGPGLLLEIGNKKTTVAIGLEIVIVIGILQKIAEMIIALNEDTHLTSHLINVQVGTLPEEMTIHHPEGMTIHHLEGMNTHHQ